MANFLGRCARVLASRSSLLSYSALIAVIVAVAVVVLPGAMADAALPDGSCGVCVLALTGNALTETGNGSLVVDGANLLVNSSSNSAVRLTGNDQIAAPSVAVVGGVTVTGRGSVSNVTRGIRPIADP